MTERGALGAGIACVVLLGWHALNIHDGGDGCRMHSVQALMDVRTPSGQTFGQALAKMEYGLTPGSFQRTEGPNCSTDYVWTETSWMGAADTWQVELSANGRTITGMDALTQAMLWHMGFQN